MSETTSKPKGWFSRRHQTRGAHEKAQYHHTFPIDRQEAAYERAREYADLTVEEKIESLGDYRAKKERAKLQKLIDAQPDGAA
jgi:hypothetical protein